MTIQYEPGQKCPKCGSTDLVVLYKTPEDTVEATCKMCSYVWQMTPMDKAP